MSIGLLLEKLLRGVAPVALFLILIGRQLARGLAKIALVVFGAAMFVCAHLLNNQLCRSCERCHD